MTSLLFVNQHYYPDVASTGQHLTDLAEHLAREGYAVEVLASRGRYVAGRMNVPARELRNGVRIRRVRTTAFGRRSHLGRIIDYLSFYLHVLAALLFGPRRDGVIFLTTPPLLCVLGSIARLLRGQVYGIWSMDLHPDAEIASGMLRAGSPLARLLEWANATGYRRASLVVDLGPYMKQRLVANGVAAERTHTVNVWSAKEEILPTPRDENPLIDALGLREKFVVMYSGNAGLVHDFRDICQAMRLLDGDPRIQFLFVGDGPRRAEIEQFAGTHGLRNFAYRGYFERDQLRWSLPLADVHLISLRAPFVGISVPGKLYGIMAAARPAVFVGPERCESAETILRAGCGAVVDPEQLSASAAPGGHPAAERIAALLRCWADQPAVAQALGARGRRAFLAEYEREGNCRAFGNAIATVWPARQPAAAPVARPTAAVA
ncbi:MAG TPA: glycosyltransferase family 4 protein, partial [Gemmatimonadaceae bacterium]|nr:glycosyltransferase family 4 protein [Gemmatimonadaceae bacterium]